MISKFLPSISTCIDTDIFSAEESPRWIPTSISTTFAEATTIITTYLTRTEIGDSSEVRCTTATIIIAEMDESIDIHSFNLWICSIYSDTIFSSDCEDIRFWFKGSLCGRARITITPDKAFICSGLDICTSGEGVVSGEFDKLTSSDRGMGANDLIFATSEDDISVSFDFIFFSSCNN